MRLVTFILSGLLTAARLAYSQSVGDHIAAGDRDHVARNAQSALAHYEAALALDSTNSDALTKAAYEAVDLGEFTANPEQRASLFRSGEHYARRAVAANPRNAEAHFQLAAALGRTALALGPRDRVKYAREVRDEALAALALEPHHSGALHVMGMWNAEVMRLNAVARMIAKRFLGGGVFDEANWDNAQRFLEQAVAADPGRIVHHLDLGQVYADRHEPVKAIEQLEFVVRAPVSDYNDPNYKKAADRLLRELRELR
jgi:tetratricopeptide (TPR) repeat protein